MADANLSAAELRADFSYDPQTGLLTRISGQRAGRVVGYSATNGYVTVTYRKRLHLAHRMIWCIATGAWPSGQIDHINGDKQDNRLVNLRDVSPQVNSQNRHGALRSNRTGTLGVTPTKSGRYMARVLVAGRRHYLGSYDTLDAAQQVYNAAKLVTNSPTGV